MTRSASVSLSALLVAVAVSSAFAQKTPKPAPFSVNVFGDSWESGELKSCTTYPKFPYLLVCDYDGFLKLIVPKIAADVPRQEAAEQAAEFAKDHSKRFLVQFSKLPWRVVPNKKADALGPVFTKPEPDSPDMAIRATWNCSKDRAITCTFLFNDKSWP